MSPETLLTWEQRFGFPSSTPAEPRYNQSEALALRDSLDNGASIASAVAMARDRIKRRRAPVPGGLFDHHRDGGLALIAPGLRAQGTPLLIARAVPWCHSRVLAQIMEWVDARTA